MIRFNGNFSGVKDKITFLKVVLTEQWRQATESAKNPAMVGTL